MERVPPELCNEPLVVSAARKRGKKPEEMLLDWGVHSAVMKRLEDWRRRGRPDQVYKFLSLCQESLANQSGELRVFVHTRDNEVVSINPKTRLPGFYPAFFISISMPGVSQVLSRVAVPVLPGRLFLISHTVACRAVSASARSCPATGPAGSLVDWRPCFAQGINAY